MATSWRFALRAGLAVVCAFVAARPAQAVCRVVEPASDTGGGVAFDPTTTMLFVIAPDQLVDYDCEAHGGLAEPTGEADAGAADPDAGGADPDAGLAEVDAGAPGPLLCVDGTPAAEVRDTLVSVVVQPIVFARGGKAGLIMPLPSRSDVHAAPAGLLEAVGALEVARIEERTEYVEDSSLGYQCYDPHYGSALDTLAAAPLALYGCSSDAAGPYYRPGTDRRETEVFETDGGVVAFERLETTADYDVTVLNASSLEALHAWLAVNEFVATADDEAAFGHYVDTQSWFLAIQIHPADLGGARTALAPIVATFRSDEIPLMNRLQHQPGGGLVFTNALVLAPWRAEPHDGSGDVLHAAPAAFADEPIAGFGLASGWFTHMTIARQTSVWLEDSAIGRAESQDEIRQTVRRTRRVRIAQACCADSRLPPASAARTFAGPTRTYLASESPADPGEFFTAPGFTDPTICGSAVSPGYYGSGSTSSPGYYGGGSGGGSGYACAASGATSLGLPVTLSILMIALRARRRRR